MRDDDEKVLTAAFFLAWLIFMTISAAVATKQLVNIAAALDRAYPADSARRAAGLEVER